MGSTRSSPEKRAREEVYLRIILENTSAILKGRLEKQEANDYMIKPLTTVANETYLLRK